MITVRYRGFFANQLYQYAVARLIANRSGYGIRCRRRPWSSLDFDPRELFPGMCEDLKPGRRSFDSAFPSIASGLREVAARASGGRWGRVAARYGGQSLDIEEVIREGSPQIVLSGFFEYPINSSSKRNNSMVRWYVATPRLC